MNVALGLYKIFNFEDLFKNRHIFKSGSSIKQTSKEYMSLHLNASFLEELWAFFVSDQKTVPVFFDGVSLAITHSIEDFVKAHKPWIYLVFLKAWQMA